jgi:UDP-glucose-4-epimerase GalE
MIPILVAGGAGYIGSHTAKLLRQCGFLPVVLDSLIAGHRWAVRFGPFVEGSMGDSLLVQQMVSEYGIQGAILFAAHACVGESTELPAKYYGNNVAQSIGFLDGLLAAGVRALVFSSSCAIYGIQESIPIREDSAKYPLSPYAESKLFLERTLSWYEQAYRLRSVFLRYFNAAGADPDGDLGECHDPETHLIPLAIRSALGGPELRIMGRDYETPDGTAIRDYVHVADLADAHVRALNFLLQGGHGAAFNCGSGSGYSVRQVVDKVSAISGRHVPVRYVDRRPGDAPAMVADTAWIREALGWTPKYSGLDTIVETAWRWVSNGSSGRLR